ncbi:MAG: FAD-dependent oxidoreductase [Chloroflexi bacterium]|nr:FAD-dependent oxidoreductase [Chloroflexota bacterium]
MKNEQDHYSVVVPDADYYRKMVKCQAACPVHTDARAYVTAIARGDFETGYKIAHDPNPLTTVCGRICGAPCEAACRRGRVGPDFAPVAIRPLKRVLTEHFGPETAGQLPGVARADSSSQFIPASNITSTPPGLGASELYSAARWSRGNLIELAKTDGRKRGKVAVVGAGPAGTKTGGMMRYGVPVYRVDQQAMDLEIESILELGVEIYFNLKIGSDISLTQLRRDYDAVFLGIGLSQGRRLNVEGENLDGVITAVDLLLNYNMGYKVTLGKKVIVVGGGDVAMDAARTALRLGQLSSDQKQALASDAATDEEADAVHEALDVARTVLRLGVADVKMIALESWDELPASKMEIEEALEEGIHVFPRVGPSRIIGKGGKVSGLEVIDVESVFDENHRFNPRFKANSERVWDCDTVILAIGQAADLAALGGTSDVKLSPRGFVEINPLTGQTSAHDIFAGGDVAYGPRLIINAVRDGHIAALGIEQKIQDRFLITTSETMWTHLPLHQMPRDWTQIAREKIPALPLNRRTGLSQIELGYDDHQATRQGARCLECSVNTIFDGAKCILCNGCVDVCPWDCLKIVMLDDVSGGDTLYQVIDAYITSEGDTTPLAAMIKDDAACTRCALCAKRCPTGAITMEAFRFRESLAYSGA